MAHPKFRTGDLVRFRRGMANTPGRVFEIVAVLPAEGERRYRLKASDEPHARAARESEIESAATEPNEKAPPPPNRTSRT